MRKIVIALVLLVCSGWAADAAAWSGAANIGAAIKDTAPIARVACGYDDRACSQGLYYACLQYGCRCYICGTREPFVQGRRAYTPYYQVQPDYYYSRPRRPGVQLYFGY